MRAITHVELSLDELNAAELEPFFYRLRVNEVDPLILASAVPTLSRRLRSLLRSAIPLASWRNPSGISGRDSFFPGASVMSGASPRNPVTAHATRRTTSRPFCASTSPVLSEAPNPSPTAKAVVLERVEMRSSRPLAGFVQKHARRRWAFSSHLRGAHMKQQYDDSNPLLGLIVALFVCAVFWAGVYQLAQWLLK